MAKNKNRRRKKATGATPTLFARVVCQNGSCKCNVNHFCSSCKFSQLYMPINPYFLIGVAFEVYTTRRNHPPWTRSPTRKLTITCLCQT
uniref:Uncharacterized protein n=1 Tax=Romanomermis culicivorax TaxID=13658 RepID=A0A915JPP7_ROMCU